MDISQKWNRTAFRLAGLTMAGILLVFSVWIIRHEVRSRRDTLFQGTDTYSSSPGESPSESTPEKTPEEKKLEEEIRTAHTREEFKEMLPQKGETEPEMVNRNLQAITERADAMNFSEKMTSLDHHGQQLAKYSSPESLEKMAAVMHQWTGTTARATAPAKNPPPGECDLDTIQIHRVVRTGTEAEGYRYIATVFDAQGRSMELELSPEEGLPLWKTMQRIEKNPLMNTVYRTMVMPIIDQRNAKK